DAPWFIVESDGPGRNNGSVHDDLRMRSQSCLLICSRRVRLLSTLGLHGAERQHGAYRTAPSAQFRKPLDWAHVVRMGPEQIAGEPPQAQGFFHRGRQRV